MKYEYLLPILLLVGHLAFAQDNFFDLSQTFFERSVKNGTVDYSSLAEDPQQLPKLVELVASPPEDVVAADNSLKAFWINAYNILVIHAILEAYPVRSPQDIPGFFDRRKHTVDGQEVTLNELENELLYDRFKDPRQHFALVCAARSCPHISAFTYTPDRLEEQLEVRTHVILNHEDYVFLSDDESAVTLSKIFDWYPKHFELDEGTNVIDYLNRYRNIKIPESAKISYSTYDWSLNDFTNTSTDTAAEAGINLQAYTPSTLLRTGEVEVKVFNNLYTQTAFFDENSNRVESSRSTFFTGIGSVLVGLTSSLNVGFDVYFKSVRYDNGTDRSPFSILQFSSEQNARSAISAIGPKIKVVPLERIPGLAVQMVWLVPAASDLEGQEEGAVYLDNDALQWWTQFFYDRQLTRGLLMYFEASLWVRFAVNRTDVITPIKAFLNYYPSSRWTVYSQAEVGPAWQSSGGVSSWYSQVGVGAKYSLTERLELESLYTIFPAGKSGGAGQTYNLGFRWLR